MFSATLRTLVINCNGVAKKKAALTNLVKHTDPDIFIMNETELSSSVNSTEFLPQGYIGFRKDRAGKKGGGVMIATKESFVVVDVEINDVKGEVVWVKILLKGNNPLYKGSFYRTPSDNTTYQLDELEKSLNHISERCRNKPNATIFLGGDFNAREIDWQIGSTAPGAKQGKICERVLEILGLNLLEQQVREWTRENSILDLFCTKKPGLVKSCYSIPGISDHEVVLTDCDVRAQITKKVPRKIFQWSRANWDHLRKITSEFKDKFLSDYSTKSVNENYNSLCAHINSILDEHVPSKMSKPPQSLPWFNSSLKRMCRKKQRLFNAATRTHKKAQWDRYRAHKKDTLKAVGRSRWSYINDILQFGLDNNDSKPFWCYVRSQRQDSLGVSALKEGGTLYSDVKTKAEILSRQFCSVFTREDQQEVTKLYGPNYPSID